MLTQDNITPRFELKEISKNYRSREVLKKIRLTIPERKVTALIGESGSGKSTLTRLLIRLEHPDDGEIFYKGSPIETIPIKKFRRKNQIVFQNPLLCVNPSYRISRILEEPLSIEKVNKNSIKEKIESLMDVMQLPKEYLKRYPSELSGGELQRIVLARALTLEPEFIILDEPFSALDDEIAIRLGDYLKDLIQSLGIGVFLISHNSSHIQSLADRVYCLNDGRIE